MADSSRTPDLNKDVVLSLRRLTHTKRGIAVLKREGASEESFKPEGFIQWASRLTGIPSVTAKSSLAHESMQEVKRTLLNRYLSECKTANKDFNVKHRRAMKKLAKTDPTMRRSKKPLTHDSKGAHLVHALIDKLFPHPIGRGKKLGGKGQASKKAAATRRLSSPLEPKGSGPIIYIGAFEMNRRKH